MIFNVAIQVTDAYTAANVEEASTALETFAVETWGAEGSNLTLSLVVPASDLADAARAAISAVHELAGMTAKAIEVTGTDEWPARIAEIAVPN